MEQSSVQPASRWSASMLRRDLCARAKHMAQIHSQLHDLSTGSEPVVIYGRDENDQHGNFHPESYSRIRAEADWGHRLKKVHTASRRSWVRHDWQWMELDSCCSSDALLMNIFCHPGVFDGHALRAPVAALLGVDRKVRPAFGVRCGVPLYSSKKAMVDRTEIDLVLGDLFVEAKLTEGDFQYAQVKLVKRYRDLEKVFDVDRLPHQIIAGPPLPPNVDPDDPTVNLVRRPPKIQIAGYQLIRNVLAAYSLQTSFCVLCDVRRHDLIESWYTIMSAIHVDSLSSRLKLLTWQELTAVLPSDLQEFLSSKYGFKSTATMY